MCLLQGASMQLAMSYPAGDSTGQAAMFNKEESRCFLLTNHRAKDLTSEHGPAWRQLSTLGLHNWAHPLCHAALGLEQPDVVGWSMGGIIGLELATRFGGSIGSLVLADTTLGGMCMSCLSRYAVAAVA